MIKVHNNVATKTLEYIFKQKAVYCELRNHNSCGRRPVHFLLSETLSDLRSNSWDLQKQSPIGLL